MPEPQTAYAVEALRQIDNRDWACLRHFLALAARASNDTAESYASSIAILSETTSLVTLLETCRGSNPDPRNRSDIDRRGPSSAHATSVAVDRARRGVCWADTSRGGGTDTVARGRAVLTRPCRNAVDPRDRTALLRCSSTSRRHERRGSACLRKERRSRSGRRQVLFLFRTMMTAHGTSSLSPPRPPPARDRTSPTSSCGPVLTRGTGHSAQPDRARTVPARSKLSPRRARAGAGVRKMVYLREPRQRSSRRVGKQGLEGESAPARRSSAAALS